MKNETEENYFWKFIERKTIFAVVGSTTVFTHYHETKKGVLIRTITRSQERYDTGMKKKDDLGYTRKIQGLEISNSTEITFIPDVTWDDINNQ